MAVILFAEFQSEMFTDYHPIHTDSFWSMCLEETLFPAEHKKAEHKKAEHKKSESKMFWDLCMEDLDVEESVFVEKFIQKLYSDLPKAPEENLVREKISKKVSAEELAEALTEVQEEILGEGQEAVEKKKKGHCQRKEKVACQACKSIGHLWQQCYHLCKFKGCGIHTKRECPKNTNTKSCELCNKRGHRIESCPSGIRKSMKVFA